MVLRLFITMTINKAKEIPKFNDVEKEALFWDTHSIADYMGKLERIDNPFTTKKGRNAVTKS